MWVVKEGIPGLKSLKAFCAMFCNTSSSMPVVNKPTTLAQISGNEIKSFFHEINVSFGIVGSSSGTKRPPSLAYADNKTFKKQRAM